MVAFSSSLDQACNELHRDGIKRDRNVIDRIVNKAGSEQLTLRERMLSPFESGKTEAEMNSKDKRCPPTTANPACDTLRSNAIFTNPNWTNRDDTEFSRIRHRGKRF